MFQPMALTVIFALGRGLRPVADVRAGDGRAAASRGRVREQESRRDRRGASALYEPALRWALRLRGLVVVAAARCSAVGALARSSARSGRSSCRRSTSSTSWCRRSASRARRLREATAMQRELERRRAATCRRSRSCSRGPARPRSASDPMPPNVSDTFVILKPRAEWPDPQRHQGRRARAHRGGARRACPGNAYEFTQPIQMRFNELIAGVRGDVAVKVFGDDFDALLARGAAHRHDRCEHVPGAADVQVEQIAGLPLLDVDIDRARASRATGSASPTCTTSSPIAVGGRAGGAGLRGRPALRPRRAPARRVARGPRRAANAADPADARGRAAPTRVALRRRRPRARRGCASCRSARSPTLARQRRAEPDQPRERQAPHRRAGQRPRPRHRLVRRRGAAARVAADVTLPPGSWLALGRAVREPGARPSGAWPSSCRSASLVILLLLYGTFGALRPTR